jgi:hypothetical protein
LLAPYSSFLLFAQKKGAEKKAADFDTLWIGPANLAEQSDLP